MKEQKKERFQLRHGPTVRTFKDVIIRHPSFPKRDKDGNLLEMVELTDRWELEGIELKQEATQRGNLRVVEVPVVVGFLPDNVVE